MKTYVRFIPIITTTDHMFSCHVLRPDTIWALLKALSWRTQKRKKLQLQWLYRDIKLIVLWNYHFPCTQIDQKRKKKTLLMTPNLILTKLTENSLSIQFTGWKISIVFVLRWKEFTKTRTEQMRLHYSIYNEEASESYEVLEPRKGMLC